MEVKDTVPTCRLCLKTSNRGFVVLQKFLNLDSLQLFLDLTITDEPTICETCADSLTSCLSFKSECVITESEIVSLLRSENKLKLDLREVCRNEIKRKGGDSYDCVVCRLCLEVVSSFMPLEHIDREMLRNHFPELDFDIVTQPVICPLCEECLQLHFAFIKDCLRTEEHIIEYIKVEGTNSNGHVDLSEVAKFVSKRALRNEGTSCAIKIEETSMESEAQIAHSNRVKTEICMDETPQLKVEVEATECHTPQENLLIAEPYTYKCEFCEYCTNDIYHLKQHTYSHRNLSERPLYKCHNCNYQVNSKSNLAKHMLAHRSKSEVALHKCTECSFESKYRASLQRHMLIHKSPSEVKMHECTECIFQSKYKKCLREHLLIHQSGSDMVLYGCASCSFLTKSESYLRIHMETHERDSYKCQLCEYETKNKSNFSRHVERHNRGSVKV